MLHTCVAVSAFGLQQFSVDISCDCSFSGCTCAYRSAAILLPWQRASDKMSSKALYERVMFQDFDEFEDNTEELMSLQVRDHGDATSFSRASPFAAASFCRSAYRFDNICMGRAGSAREVVAESQQRLDRLSNMMRDAASQDGLRRCRGMFAGCYRSAIRSRLAAHVLRVGRRRTVCWRAACIPVFSSVRSAGPFVRTAPKPGASCC